MSEILVTEKGFEWYSNSNISKWTRPINLQKNEKKYLERFGSNFKCTNQSVSSFDLSIVFTNYFILF